MDQLCNQFIIMPVTNLIINGTFSSGAANWTANDIEAGNAESAYLTGGSSTNRVLEIDAGAGLISVIEQNFTVTTPITTELSLDVALRNIASPTNNEGVTAEILDSSGVVIASITLTPTANAWSTHSVPVTFATAGTYTLRLTELGTNDSLGVIVDNIEILVCFCKGTQIRTANGNRPVETLRAGDLIVTQSGLKPLRWIGRRSVSACELLANPKLRPVRIAQGALGQGLPSHPLRVSRQHRMVARSRVVQRMFGTDQALIAANKLVGLHGVTNDDSLQPVTYFHMLFDDHEIVLANDTPSESLLATPRTVASLTEDAQTELLTLFPGLADPQQSACLIPPLKRQKQLIGRLAKNRRAVLEPEQAQPRQTCCQTAPTSARMIRAISAQSSSEKVNGTRISTIPAKTRSVVGMGELSA